jgi:Mn-dependent DtxR family transcriptional regulator
MSEAAVLRLVASYPDARALARHLRDSSGFVVLRRLEDRGLVTRRRPGLYRLTRCGRSELAMTHALARLVTRALERSA